MKWQYTRAQIKVDTNAFSQRLILRTKKLWRASTRAFIQAILNAQVVHVDTGMSMGSLIPLARRVGMVAMVRSYISIYETRTRTGYTDMNETYISGVTKDVALGESLGETGFEYIIGTKENPIFKTSFNIKVYQYAKHENEISNAGGPWNSLQIGRDAFEAYFKEHADELIPRPYEWIFKKGGR